MPSADEIQKNYRVGEQINPGTIAADYGDVMAQRCQDLPTYWYAQLLAALVALYLPPLPLACSKSPHAFASHHRPTIQCPAPRHTAHITPVSSLSINARCPAPCHPCPFIVHRHPVLSALVAPPLVLLSLVIPVANLSIDVLFPHVPSSQCSSHPCPFVVRRRTPFLACSPAHPSFPCHRRIVVH